MSFTIIESRPPELIINPDCDGPDAKRRAVFLGRLLTPGTDTPADLDPHNNQPVHMTLAADTDLAHAREMLRLATEERSA